MTEIAKLVIQKLEQLDAEHQTEKSRDKHYKGW